MNLRKIRKEKGITLIALVITIIVYLVSYDKNRKYCNLVGFAYNLYKFMIELLLKKIIILFFYLKYEKEFCEMNNEKLKESYIDERTNIEYRLVGDYYIPNIVLPKPRRTGNVGKYGRMRAKYLKENHKVEYSLMLIDNELTSYLLDIDDACKERLVNQMAKEEKINEELKANNQIKWVKMMNNIKERAEGAPRAYIQVA